MVSQKVTIKNPSDLSLQRQYGKCQECFKRSWSLY